MRTYKLGKRAYRTKANKLTLKELKLRHANLINDYKKCLAKVRHVWVKKNLIPKILVDEEKARLKKLNISIKDTRNEVEYTMRGLNLDGLFKIITKTNVYSGTTNTFSAV